MFNNFEKQVVKAISDLTPLVQELSKNHDIHKVSLAFTSSLFCFGKQPLFSIQASEKQTDNYEIHWDSLIFAIMGADAKADIIDSVDVERITAAAITAVKKLASDRDEKQRIAEAFQTASENPLPDAYFSILHRPYYQNGVHAGYITMPGNTELTDEDEANLSSFIQRSSKGIGTFKDIFVYRPAPTFASQRAHYRKLIESEISDFFAGLYQPGRPDIQDGATLQAELMKRVAVLFENEGAE